MKNIFEAPFVREMEKTTANMYRLGWDERNGGNVSYLLDEKEVAEYLDLNHVIRTIPTGFDAKPLIGKIFIVTGTGKYFKNVESDPETNLGIVRIGKDGTTAELLWGYKDGGRFTSEFPAHMMSHMARLAVDPQHRIVMHTHPTYTIAMNAVCPKLIRSPCKPVSRIFLLPVMPPTNCPCCTKPATKAKLPVKTPVLIRPLSPACAAA